MVKIVRLDEESASDWEDERNSRQRRKKRTKRKQKKNVNMIKIKKKEMLKKAKRQQNNNKEIRENTQKIKYTELDNNYTINKIINCYLEPEKDKKDYVILFNLEVLNSQKEVFNFTFPFVFRLHLVSPNYHRLFLVLHLH